MYSVLLILHSVLRWVVIVAAVAAVVRGWSGWMGGRVWTDADRGVGKLFTISMDVQLVLGLLLYFVFSPVTRAAMQDMGAAMAVRETRFFAAEHLAIMVVAVVAVHVTSVLARRGSTDASRFRRAAIGYTLSLLLVLVGIPWFRGLWPGLG